MPRRDEGQRKTLVPSRRAALPRHRRKRGAVGGRPLRYRGRVEQIEDVIKSHRLFAPRVYQRSYHTLVPLLKIVGHVHAFELRARQRFDTYGPWQHTY